MNPCEWKRKKKRETISETTRDSNEKANDEDKKKTTLCNMAKRSLKNLAYSKVYGTRVTLKRELLILFFQIGQSSRGRLIKPMS